MRNILVLIILLTGSLLRAQQVDLKPGDLLFYTDTEGMGAAVKESTGEYTHVAMVESAGDTVWIIDATRRYGVSRRPFLRNPQEESMYPDLYRLNAPFDTLAVLARARSFIGQPYDDAFLPDNGQMYCSELIYECYLGTKGNHLFEARPMNWRNKEGKMPKYWKRHFRKLKMAVPEGVPGTNPTALSQSPQLRKIEN